MVQLTERVHHLLTEHVPQGTTVIDATCGNGFDTQFLSDLVGESGHVIACDIQPTAIEKTKHRCSGSNHITYKLGDHAEILNQHQFEVDSKVTAVVFNLGYLPGSDKSVTTTEATSVIAVKAALKILSEGGICSVLAYVGHPGGKEEAAAIEKVLTESLQQGNFRISHWPESNAPQNCPQLFAIQKLSK